MYLALVRHFSDRSNAIVIMSGRTLLIGIPNLVWTRQALLTGRGVPESERSRVADYHSGLGVARFRHVPTYLLRATLDAEPL